MNKISIKREQSQAGLSFAEREKFRPQVKNKLLLLLALLMTAVTGAWAANTVTWTAQNQLPTLGGKTTATIDGVTITATSAITVNGGRATFNGATFSVEDGNITKIVLKSVSGVSGYPAGWTIVNTDATWTGSATSVSCGYSGGVYSIEFTIETVYSVTMKDGVKDADKWTVKVGEGQAQALPIGGLKGDGSETVTLQYNGRLKVKGVKATSDAQPAEETVTLATPLTIEAITAGTIVVQSPKNGMKYSLNGGAKQPVSEACSTANIPVEAGDKVAFYGDGTSITKYDGTVITGSGDGFTCKVYGNIMSLVDENNYETATTLPNVDYVFYELFSGNTALTDASQLLLPATTLANYCYYSMFRNCVNLTAAPALPATALADYCYCYMFYGCRSLTAAPALPATTLANSCYRQMFRGCTGLTAAPELPATTLVQQCYYQMFSVCSNLSSVTCLATSGINESSSTTNWLDGAGSNVTGTKTFTAATSATWPEGNNGIPTGWTRVNKQ